MASLSLRPSTVIIVVVALTSVTAQTYQYSQGWTNGKRDGHRQLEVDMREMANNLEKTLSPCQLSKLKYVLEGKPFNERLMMPCDYVEEEETVKPKRAYKERSQDPLFEGFL